MKPTVDHIPTVPKAPAADVVGARPCSLLAANVPALLSNSISATVSRDQTSQPYSIDDKPNIFHVFVPQIEFRPPGRAPTFINKPVACFPFFCSSHNGNILMFLTWHIFKIRCHSWTVSAKLVADLYFYSRHYWGLLTNWLKINFASFLNILFRQKKITEFTVEFANNKLAVHALNTI